MSDAQVLASARDKLRQIEAYLDLRAKFETEDRAGLNRLLNELIEPLCEILEAEEHAVTYSEQSWAGDYFSPVVELAHVVLNYERN